MTATAPNYLDPNDSSFRLSDGWSERLVDIAEECRDAEPDDAAARVGDRLPADYRDDPVLGEGAGRVVARLPEAAIDMTREREHVDYVVKFPKAPNPDIVGPGGLIQNGEEAITWRETHSQYLLPVTAHHPDRWWLVMPRGDPVLQYTRSELVKWMAKAKDDLDGRVAADDIYEENVVWMHSDDSPYLCDYGTTSIR